MKHCFHLILAIAFLGLGFPEASAELRLSGIFADQMVLQRDQPIPVWGWAEAGGTISG